MARDIPANPRVNPRAAGEVVGGVFDNADAASRAVKALEKAHFPKDSISIAVREGAGGREVAHRTGARERPETEAAFRSEVKSTFGAPPVGSPADLHTTLAAGVSGDVARYFIHAVEQGKALVTVLAEERGQEAAAILRAEGADMGPAAVAEPVIEPVAAAPEPPPIQTAIPPPPEPAAVPPGEHQRVQLVGEKLKVEKTPPVASEVNIHKEVVTEPHSVELPVEREELVVERHPGGDIPAGRPVGATAETTRIPLTEQRTKVVKEPVVRENVDVSTRKVTETERVTEPLQHEEARIEGAPAVMPVKPAPPATEPPPATPLTKEQKRYQEMRRRQDEDRQRRLAEEARRRPNRAA